MVKRSAVLLTIFTINVIFACVKLLVGIEMGSIAVINDGYNNVLDSVIIALFFLVALYYGFYKVRIRMRFKIENIICILAYTNIIIVAVDLITRSLDRIIAPTPVVYENIFLGFLIINVLVKLGIMAVLFKFNRKKKDGFYTAVGIDSLMDAIIGVFLIVSYIISSNAWMMSDGVLGLIIAGFIMINAFFAIIAYIRKLTSVRADKVFKNCIVDTLLSTEGVKAYDNINIEENSNSIVAYVDVYPMDGIDKVIVYDSLAVKREELKSVYDIEFRPTILDKEDGRVVVASQIIALYAKFLPIIEDYSNATGQTKITVSFANKYKDKYFIDEICAINTANGSSDTKVEVIFRRSKT